MKKEMENMSERLEEFLLRAERFGESFNKNTESLSFYEQSMVKLKKELTLEIEGLRTERHAIGQSLSTNIDKTINESIKSALPTIMPGLIAEFISKTENIATATTKKAETLNDTIDTTVKRAASLIANQKSSMTFRKVGLTATFCFSSLLTAYGIHYFFPTNIIYQMSPKMIHSYFMGEAAIDMYDELSQKQKDRLLESVRRRYKAGIAKHSN